MARIRGLSRDLFHYFQRPVRILCCINRDLASNHALNLLLPQLGQHEVKLICSARVGRVALPAHLRAFNMMEQAIPNEIVFPLAERCIREDERWLTFSELAMKYTGMPLTILDLNSEDGAQLLSSYAPDLILTIRYGHILKGEAIAAPRLGVLNLHSGVLPDYRGILSTLYAIANGETEIGITLHWIVDAGIDSGPLVAVALRPVEVERSLLWHILSLYPLGIPLIVEAVRRLTTGEELPRASQPAGRGVYRSIPTAADVAALRGRGVELFDTADLRDLRERYGAAVLETVR